MTGANSSSTSQCSMKCDSRHQRLPSTACRSLRGAGPRHLHTHTRQSTPGRRRDRQSLRGRFEPTLDSQTVAATRSPTGEGSGALLPRYPGQGKARQGKKLPLRHQAHGTRYTSIAPRLCTADGVRLQMEDSSTTAPRLRRAATWAPVRAMMPPMHRIAQAVTIPSAASPWCVCVCVCVCVCALVTSAADCCAAIMSHKAASARGRAQARFCGTPSLGFSKAAARARAQFVLR